jgi:hypothetical protein
MEKNVAQNEIPNFKEISYSNVKKNESYVEKPSFLE